MMTANESPNMVAEVPRTRDPARKQRILVAAADLLARNGYHSVGMADIGAAAGVTGAAIYRHFESKSAVLVALFDRVIDELLSKASEVVSADYSDQEALGLLVRDQVLFAIDERVLLQVYSREIHNLPEEDRRRLRRKQRLYLEEWVHIIAELRPDLIDSEVRTMVHAAISTIQSILDHESGLARERLIELMSTAALAVLGVDSMSRSPTPGNRG
ncbi:TetR family transcriptional regulator [Sciscionella marina]|uniref:TetR family transcriptional regulator n=1 Tax=Sciscionella marina TaxID=508770 RepID=UPI00058F6812